MVLLSLLYADDYSDVQHVAQTASHSVSSPALEENDVFSYQYFLYPFTYQRNIFPLLTLHATW